MSTGCCLAAVLGDLCSECPSQLGDPRPYQAWCSAWNNGSHPVTMRGANLRSTQNTEDSREKKMEELGSLVMSFSCCLNHPGAT